VIVVQTKASRMGMYLMGQALFSARLALRAWSEERALDPAGAACQTASCSRSWRTFPRSKYGPTTNLPGHAYNGGCSDFANVNK